MTGPTTWGILSAGRISHDWAVAASTLPKDEHQVLAVAARNVDSAREFAKEHGIPKVHNSYEELVKDKEIQVIYIGTLHTEHLWLVKLCFDHGKHVLCEKPLAMNVRETKELVEYARSKKLFFMEAIWSRFFPAYQRLKEELAKGTVGDVLQVTANMGLFFPEDDWRRDLNQGGGNTLDMGTYTCQIAALAFKGLKPLKIVASGHLNKSGADDSASATIIYPQGKTATILTHTLVNTPCEALLIGTKGTLKLHYPFWSATKLSIKIEGEEEKLLEFPLPHSDKRINYWNSTGLSYQCREVRRCVEQGLLESPELPWDETILLAEMRESIRKQVGVIYPQDNA